MVRSVGSSQQGVCGRPALICECVEPSYPVYVPTCNRLLLESIAIDDGRNEPCASHTEHATHHADDGQNVHSHVAHSDTRSTFSCTMPWPAALAASPVPTPHPAPQQLHTV